MKIIVLISYILMIAVNALANILPIGGISTGQISDFYANLFAPTPITFAIWGLIYLLLAIYVFYQLGKRSKKITEVLDKIAPYFITSSIANALWIVAWHNKLIFLSVLLMLGIFYSLLKINNILKTQKFDIQEKFFIKIPFSIYFGWITIATIANITTFLVSIRWYGFGLTEVTWTVIILIIGTLIGMAKVLKDEDIIYGLVFIWAYLGILTKHISPNGFDSEYTPIIITTPITIVILILAKIYTYVKTKRFV